MSTFEVPVYKIDSIEKHPNADKLEVLCIKGFRTLQPIGMFSVGELVAYIPEDSILPENIIEDLGLTGKIKPRVRPVRLRGVYSEGLAYKARPHWRLGQDVAEQLGITKYQVDIPIHLRGNIQSNKSFNSPKTRTLSFDVENLRKNFDVFEGREVEITEKIHGTNLQIGIFPENISLWKRIVRFFTPRCFTDPYAHHTVTSKGFAKKGWVRKLDWENDEPTDTYWKAALSLNIFEKKVVDAALQYTSGRPLFLIGEIFGPGIQKGFPYGDKVQVRIFDVYFGDCHNGYYLSPDKAREVLELLNKAGANDIQFVPVFWRGIWDKEKALQLTDGLETLSGNSLHIREGVVVTDTETNKKLKLVSEAYKLRNMESGTDYE
jgi:RNA ligase (TIGR02306 family)